jgi:hypothetical protein
VIDATERSSRSRLAAADRPRASRTASRFRRLATRIDATCQALAGVVLVDGLLDLGLDLAGELS